MCGHHPAGQPGFPLVVPGQVPRERVGAEASRSLGWDVATSPSPTPINKSQGPGSRAPLLDAGGAESPCKAGREDLGLSQAAILMCFPGPNTLVTLCPSGVGGHCQSLRVAVPGPLTIEEGVGTLSPQHH